MALGPAGSEQDLGGEALPGEGSDLGAIMAPDWGIQLAHDRARADDAD